MMERLIDYHPDSDGGGDDSSAHNLSNEQSPEESAWDKLMRATTLNLQFKLGDISEAELEAGMREISLTYEEKWQLSQDLQLPPPAPGIDPALLKDVDFDEPYSWMKFAGIEPTQEEIELRGEPVEAFAKYVIGDDDEATRVLQENAYNIPRFVEVLDQLAVAAEEDNDWTVFDNLARFSTMSRSIFPKQFPQLVRAISRAEHPVTRGVAGFSLPYLMDIDSKEAIEIWRLLLNDPVDARPVDAAVMIYDLVQDPKMGLGRPKSRKLNRKLGKEVARAKLKLEMAGFTRSVDLDHND